MSLITEIEKLRELEQQATPGKWHINHDEIITEDKMDIDGEGDRFISIPNDVYDVELITELRNAAPAMIEVLECFRGGDAMRLQKQLDYLESTTPEPDTWSGQIVDMVARLQKAASLMEGKE